MSVQRWIHSEEILFVKLKMGKKKIWIMVGIQRTFGAMVTEKSPRKKDQIIVA
jgi:hypothetical protein